MKASRYCKKNNGKNCEVCLQKVTDKPPRSKKTGRFLKRKKTK